MIITWGLTEFLKVNYPHKSTVKQDIMHNRVVLYTYTKFSE